MSRQLASIQKIKNIKPIEGKDRILSADILDWHCVTNKENGFKEDSLVVYFEIDSILPEREEFEFLRVRKFRIKSIKLGGKLAQGLIMPLEILVKAGMDPKKVAKLKEGDDVTEVIGITKYESDPDNVAISQPKGFYRTKIKPFIYNILYGKGTMKGGGYWPAWLPHTDETRVQVLGKLIESEAGQEYYVTEKLDGSSETIFFNDGTFGITSRNTVKFLSDGRKKSGFVRKTIQKVFGKFFPVSSTFMTPDHFTNVATALNIESKLRELGRNIAIQGEIIGSGGNSGKGIQGNKYSLDHYEFRAFQVLDINKKSFVDLWEFENICSDLKIQTIPIINRNFVLNHNPDQLVELAKGDSVLKKGVKREGIVLRPTKERKDSHGSRISFKAINPDFLLKYED